MAAKQRRKRVYCTNCKIQLKEKMNFCFNCGQENHRKRASVKLLLYDFLSTYFTFDSKLLRTLKVLITKPSFLTYAYLKGEVVSYLRPIRLYIFISFIFFLLSTNTATYTETVASINVALNELPFTVGDIESGFEDTDASTPKSENSLDKKIKAIFSSDRETVLFLNYLVAKLPLVLFGMIPVLGLLFYMFFYKDKYYYIDHLIFSLHLQCFLLSLLIVTTVLYWLLKIDLSVIAFLASLIYGYIAALKFYKGTKLVTFSKLCLIGFFHTLLIVFVCILFFLLAMQTYTV